MKFWSNKKAQNVYLFLKNGAKLHCQFWGNSGFFENLEATGYQNIRLCDQLKYLDQSEKE